MLTEALVLEKVVPVINEGIREQFALQGHHLTGAWEDSLYADITEHEAIGYAKAYGVIVNAGTTPGRIPFSGTGGDGTGRSAYIQGLISFFKKRGFDEKKATSYAFATAKVQKREGMSTHASARFSETGQRQRFIQATEAAITEKVDEMIVSGLDEVINDTVNEKQLIEF